MADHTLTRPKEKPAKEQEFTVTTSDLQGNLAVSKHRGTSRSRLRMDLKAAGQDVVDIRAEQPWWRGGSRSRVPSRVLLDTTRQLAAFCEAGISILDALVMIGDATRNPAMKHALLTIAEDIRDGETLPQAAQAHTSVFPDYYIAMLEAAERTGNLPATFDTLAGYLERDTASRRAVKSALSYPVILVALGTVAVLVLSTIVLPKFVEFFNDLDTELPLATRLLLQTTAFVGTWWWAILGTIAIVSLLVFTYARTVAGGRRIDHVKLRLPIVGPLLRDIALERFSRVLSNLSGAGVPLVDALRLSSSAVGNRHYAAAVVSTRDGVLRGQGLAAPMRDTGVFPPEIVQVLGVGERTGRLTEQLDHAARFYAREVDYRLKNLTALLEPVALLIVGGAVGFVAVALVSAMYGIYSSTTVTG